MEFMLSPLQMMYMAGSREDLRSTGSIEGPADITGVPCHVYMEFESSFIDHGDLKAAWSGVLRKHPALTASYRSDGRGILLSTPYSESIVFIDLRHLENRRKSEELARIRKKLVSRLTLLERGQCVGLALIRVDGLNYRLIFDLNLVACDVASYHRILCELHDLYLSGGKFSDQGAGVSEEATAMLDREYKINAPDIRFWEERLRSIAASKRGKAAPSFYCVDNELLVERVYESLDFVISDRAARPLYRMSMLHGISPYSIILTKACHELAEWGSVDSITACVPFFHESNEDIFGDFTDLAVVSIVPSRNVVEDSMLTDSILIEAKGHSRFCTQVVQQEMGRNKVFPDVVFTTTPGIGLIGGSKRPTLGRLSYYCSQTPQVGLDIQVSEVDSGFVIHWVVPKGLFNEYELREHFNEFCSACLQVEKEERE